MARKRQWLNKSQWAHFYNTLKVLQSMALCAVIYNVYSRDWVNATVMGALFVFILALATWAARGLDIQARGGKHTPDNPTKGGTL